MRRVLDDRRVQIFLAAVVAYSTLYWVPYSPLPDVMPWGVIAQGVIFGTSNALLAMGLILIYRTTRIVNFAYGAMGAMPGALTVGLFVEKGWNYWLAIAVGLIVGVASGALLDILVIRRFARSSRLVLTVASIGIAQLLGAIALIITVAMGSDTLIGNIKTPIDASFFIRPYPIRGDHLLMLGVAPIVLAALGWFLLRTDAGVAVRAAAENQDRAMLLAVPVRRLQTIVWAIAGGLATLTFITKAPFGGVVPSALVGADAILPGLAVAVVARFKSLPGALVAGIGLGIVEWTVRWNIHAESIFDVTFLVIILGALLLRRDHLTRAETGESSWDSAGVLKPIPAELRRLPEVRRPIWIGAAALVALILVVSLNASPTTVLLMTFAVIWGIVAVSLVVLTGWGGNISLGQFAIVGAGAMAAGNLMMRWNVDFFIAAAFAALVGAVVAVLIGLPALRIRGLYLAVTTLAFAVALDSYFLNPVNFSSYVPEQVIRPVLWKRFDMGSEWITLYFSIGALVLITLVVRAIRRSRAGRVMIATRDNDRAADAFAVPTTRVKLQTFVFAGAIAGLAGALYVLALSGSGQGTFKPGMSLEVFSFAVIGGLGSVAGALSGVFFFRGVDFVLAENFSGSTAEILRLSLTGAGLLFVLYFLPGGLWQLVQAQRDRYLRWVANRRDLLVPSLVADRRVDDDADDHAEDETSVIAGALK
ncbi:MAG TPA: ABC transporter permease [Acidimicrobiales bacterium]|nr:ABC transporter permease [Acidimicrobiales bacterium]